MKQKTDWRDELKSLKERLDKIPECKLTIEGNIYEEHSNLIKSFEKSNLKPKNNIDE